MTVTRIAPRDALELTRQGLIDLMASSHLVTREDMRRPPTDAELVEFLSPHQLFRDEGAPGLLVGLRRNAFESDVFRMGVSDLFIVADAGTPGSAVSAMVSSDRLPRADLLHTRVPASDPRLMDALIMNGYHAVDASVSLRLREWGGAARQGTDAVDAEVGDASTADIDEVADLASHLFSGRYRHERGVSEEHVDEYYRRWATNCLEGRAQLNRVMRRDGAVIGFYCIIKRTFLDIPIGHVDLIGVRADLRGRGYGGALLADCLDRLRGNVEILTLGTHLTNTAAISMYVRNGFRTTGLRVSFHRRPSDDRVPSR